MYVRDGVVARWDDTSKVMTFRGEGRGIREAYKRLLEEGKREENQFSERRERRIWVERLDPRCENAPGRYQGEDTGTHSFCAYQGKGDETHKFCASTEGWG